MDRAGSRERTPVHSSGMHRGRTGEQQPDHDQHERPSTWHRAICRGEADGTLNPSWLPTVVIVASHGSDSRAAARLRRATVGDA